MAAAPERGGVLLAPRDGPRQGPLSTAGAADVYLPFTMLDQPDAPPRAAAAWPIRLAGMAAELLADAALWLPEARLLAVADLHLEKGSAFARRGQPLPPYDTAETLRRLSGLVGQIDPDTVVCLGDSFHDRYATARVDAADAAELARLVARTRRWVWVTGNHDPAPTGPWGGSCAGELRVGPLTLRHAAEPEASGEVSGHYHPKLRLDLGARRISARCFVWDSKRLILPAFGAYAGGLDAHAPELACLFGPDRAAAALARGRILPAPLTRPRSSGRKAPA